MSLVDINPLPTAGNAAILLHPDDNVAIARVPIAPGQDLEFGALRLRALDPVPAGHKIALRPIGSGDWLVRYGQRIGRSSRAITPGEHVHVHNVSFEEIAFDYEFPETETAAHVPADVPTFLGYPRADGRAGTRNYIAVVAASNCAAHAAELIAASYAGVTLPENVDGIVAFPHGEGCGHAFGPDTDQLRRTLTGVLNHPNVSAAIILGLGCEVNQVDNYPTVQAMTLQTSGGTRATVEEARRYINGYIERAHAETRVPIPASKIVLGLNCGGSDSFSGITANPALGVCSDLLVKIGATPPS